MHQPLRLGVASIVAFTDIKRAFKLARELGVSHVCLFYAEPHFPTQERPPRDFSYVIKAPCFVENIASRNPRVRSLALSRISRAIRLASELEADAVIIRAGMFFVTERERLDEAWTNTVEGVKSLLELAVSVGVELHVENYPYPIDVVRSPADFEKLRSEVGGELRLALNVPHALAARVRREEIKRVKDRIGVVIVGDAPSPWELRVRRDLRSRVMALTKEVLEVLTSPLVIVAGLSESAVKWFVRCLMCDSESRRQP